MDHQEFYIGWMPGAPKGLSSFLRKSALALGTTAIVSAAVLALQQKKFTTARFEFGQLTEVNGVYQSTPVPSIRVVTGKDPDGKGTVLTMPLVGYGKFGAEGVISDWQHEHKVNLEGQQVTFKGTLLYSDGKSLLQIDAHDQPIQNWKAAPQPYQSEQKELGLQVVKGEVLDPKCFFGVMKPGYGKPHLDCAVRCIEGGMSPVLMMQDEKGNTTYALILDKKGQKMNHFLKDYIAQPIEFLARVVRNDDWLVVYMEPGTIRHTNRLSWTKVQDDIISCHGK